MINSALNPVRAAQIPSDLDPSLQIAELTKKETRLKEVFQQATANFREAVFCLFGYR